MKVILTGSSGFVGKNLIRFFDDHGYQSYQLSLRTTNFFNQLNYPADAVIHLAGKAHDTTNRSEEKDYFAVNRDLTIELYNSFLKSEIQDFFYFSSVKAVADTVEDILNEDVLGNPATPYGKSKRDAENYLLDQILPEGKRLFIIRPCMIHGPGNKGNFNLLYKLVEKGAPWPLAAFHNKRSFLSIDNLSFLLKEMVESSNIPSGIYNFADDDPLSTNDLVTIISETLGKKTRLLHLSPGLIKLVAKVGDIIPSPLNSERLKKLTECYVVSNMKIKRALGIDSLPVSAREGLIKTILSFKE